MRRCRLPDRIESVIVPWPGITDGELDILTKAGVVGYRITWRLTKTIDQTMVARTHEHGWSMHYLHHADDPRWTIGSRHILADARAFVLEHMGGVDPGKGIDGDGFKFVLRCLDTGRCWVKLSPRISKQDDFPFSDTDPLVTSSCSTRRAACCGARTGRIRNTSSRCRTTWLARHDARLGAGRENPQADLRRQSGRAVRDSAGVTGRVKVRPGITQARRRQP